MKDELDKLKEYLLNLEDTIVSKELKDKAELTEVRDAQSLVKRLRDELL